MEGLSAEIENELRLLSEEYDELEQSLGLVEVISDAKLYSFYLKRRNEIKPLVELYKSLKKLELDFLQYDNLKEIVTSEEEKSNLESEKNKAKTEYDNIIQKIKEKILATNKNINQKIQIEITAKNENSEFASQIHESFKNFCDNNDCLTQTQKKSNYAYVLTATGKAIYEKLKKFSGLFKKIEFGKEYFATVIVLEVLQNDIQIDENDLIFETLKSSGAGGQHINKTESAVRVTHVPTKITVKCEDERSQTQNKERAIELIKEKINQKNQKNSEKYIKNQRNLQKNAIFSSSPICTLDFDKNIVSFSNEKQTKIKEFLNGDFLKIIF